jgi:hypothetical protein
MLCWPQKSSISWVWGMPPMFERDNVGKTYGLDIVPVGQKVSLPSTH